MTSISETTIVSYHPKYATAYKKLNLAWIEKYFVVEDHDREQLDNPETYIINKGGYILFAKHENEIVGTCALIKTGEAEFELAKMAVDENMRGRQIGKLIGEAAIEKAKEAGAKRVWLESNRILTTALNLYHKLGFVEIPISSTPYARADIKMEILL
jgi:N-acetylglutamate synthase-like GNAT family acetyltransferase